MSLPASFFAGPRPALGRRDARLLVACIVSYGAALRIFWPYLNDDAFIAFRYAASLVSGPGLTYNVGEFVE
jgi:hypothetical protein